MNKDAWYSWCSIVQMTTSEFRLDIIMSSMYAIYMALTHKIVDLGT